MKQAIGNNPANTKKGAPRGSATAEPHRQNRTIERAKTIQRNRRSKEKTAWGRQPRMEENQNEMKGTQGAGETTNQRTH